MTALRDVLWVLLLVLCNVAALVWIWAEVDLRKERRRHMEEAARRVALQRAELEALFAAARTASTERERLRS